MLDTLAKPAARRTLLLAGGAFGIAAAVWFAVSFRPVADLAALHPEADAAVALIAHGPEVDAVIRALPASLTYALEQGAAVGEARDDGTGLGWEPAAAAPRLGALAWLPRDVVAYGFVMAGDRRVPFTVKAGGGTVSARVGRKFAGWDGRPGLSSIKPRIERLPEETAGYAYFPYGLKGIEAVQATPFGAFVPLLEAVGKPAEVLFHASTTAETGSGGFVIHGPGHPDEAWKGDFEGVVAEFFGRIHPVFNDHTLPDGSVAQELRSEPAEKIGYRQLKTGEIIKFAPSDLSPALYFDDQDGVWIASETRIIQSAVISSITYGEEPVPNRCPSDPAEARLVIIPKNATRLFPSILDDFHVIDVFSRLEISLNSLESGLFTICGQV